MISSFCDSGACVDVARTSSFCEGGQCVVVDETMYDTIWVGHDRSDPLSDSVTYTKDEWKAFVLGVKAGEFDFDLFKE